MKALIVACMTVALITVAGFFLINSLLDDCRGNLPIVKSTVCSIAKGRGWL
ncbi:hypothetical protein GG851_02845 [Bordetella petrii]|nr:hypothetical protein [Bordetella petrii]